MTWPGLQHYADTLNPGKSSLVKQFIDNVFDDLYYPTIESSHSKTVSFNGKEFDCLIIDTAGQVMHTLHFRVAYNSAITPLLIRILRFVG